MNSDGARWSIIYEVFGPDALRHVLNLADAPTKDGPPPTSDKAREVLGLLAQSALEFYRDDATNLRSARAAIFLAQRFADTEHSLGTHMRRVCGGEIRSIEGEDLASHLQVLGQELFPSLALRGNGHMSLEFHPAWGRATELLRGEPAAGARFGPEEMISFSTIPAFLTNSFSMVRLSGQEVTVDSFLAQILESSKELEAYISTGTETGRVYLGLLGITLPSGADSIELGRWTIETRSAKHDGLFEGPFEGFTRNDTTVNREGGDPQLFRAAGNVVARTECAMSVNRISETQIVTTPDQLLARDVQALFLSLVLSSTSIRPTTTTLAWEAMWRLTQSSVPAMERGPHSIQHTKILDAEEVKSWSEWYGRVRALDLSSIEISTQRLLSAVNERVQEADKLIDSVMVWENLFGATPETTFRICASMAKLLESDSDKREATYRELKKIYRVRSNLVHGANVEPRDVSEQAKAAWIYARGALQAIIQNRTDLLQIKKSSQRSDAMLLAN